MIDPGSLYITTQVEPDDAASGFSCGKHPLDDYYLGAEVLMGCRGGPAS